MKGAPKTRQMTAEDEEKEQYEYESENSQNFILDSHCS